MFWKTKPKKRTISEIAYDGGIQYCYNAFSKFSPHSEIIVHLQNCYATEKHDHSCYEIFENALENYKTKAYDIMLSQMTLEQSIEDARKHVEKYRDYFRLNIDIDISLGRFYYPNLTYTQRYLSERQDAARDWLKYMNKVCKDESMIFKLFKSYTGDNRAFIPFTAFEFFNLHGTKN